MEGLVGNNSKDLKELVPHKRLQKQLFLALVVMTIIVHSLTARSGEINPNHEHRYQFQERNGYFPRKMNSSYSAVSDYAFSLSQDNHFNVCGVRVYNFYPLQLDNPLFCKVEDYSGAKFQEEFATVFGFNQTEKQKLMTELVRSPEILNQSVYDDSEYGYMHFQFSSKPKIDYFLLPYILVSSVEICNSTQWLSSSQMFSSRYDWALWSDKLIRDYFGHFYTLSMYWERPFNRDFVTITSIENITPSIHEHFEQEGAIVDYGFRELLMCGNRPTGLLTELEISFQLGMAELPHLVCYYPSLTYHDIALVSYNDNPRASGPYYSNPVFPLGHTAIFSGLVWNCDALLRYACDHAAKLKNEIAEEFSVLDNIINSLNVNFSRALLEAHLSTLSIDIKNVLSTYQQQIFDLQDLTVYCNSILTIMSNSSYMILFEEQFKAQSELLNVELELAKTRHDGLKSDYDFTLQIISELLADMNAQEARDQAYEQFQTALSQGIFGVIVSVAAAFLLQSISLWLRHRHHKRTATIATGAMTLQVAEALTSAMTAKQLKSILERLSIQASGPKRALALALVQTKGVGFALQALKNHVENRS